MVVFIDVFILLSVFDVLEGIGLVGFVLIEVLQVVHVEAEPSVRVVNLLDVPDVLILVLVLLFILFFAGFVGGADLDDIVDHGVVVLKIVLGLLELVGALDEELVELQQVVVDQLLLHAPVAVNEVEVGDHPVKAVLEELDVVIELLLHHEADQTQVEAEGPGFLRTLHLVDWVQVLLHEARHQVIAHVLLHLVIVVVAGFQVEAEVHHFYFVEHARLLKKGTVDIACSSWYIVL